MKTGLAKKLAHLWHGPFRVKEKETDLSITLELPDKAGYRFYPTAHVSRVKLRRIHPERPLLELALTDEEARLDFDEALLPEDSWVREDLGEYEVEALLDSRWKRISRNGLGSVNFWSSGSGMKSQLGLPSGICHAAR